jgi:hypothetical protein
MPGVRGFVGSQRTMDLVKQRSDSRYGIRVKISLQCGYSRRIEPITDEGRCERYDKTDSPCNQACRRKMVGSTFIDKEEATVPLIACKMIGCLCLMENPYFTVGEMLFQLLERELLEHLRRVCCCHVIQAEEFRQIAFGCRDSTDILDLASPFRAQLMPPHAEVGTIQGRE